MSRVCLLIAFVAAGGSAVAQPVWSRDVARIVQAKCERCHRPGDIAPFALRSYADAVERSHEIEHAVEARHMPPWKPVPGHGNFRDNFGLTDEERQNLLGWIKGGMLEGDPADLPEPLPERGEWELGDPDVVVQMSEPYFQERGGDANRCFVIPTGLTEDKYLEAVQVKPGNRQIVHHAIVFVDTTGQSAKLDEAEPGPGYTCYGGPGIELNLAAAADLASALGGWVPGSRTQRMSDGIGLWLSKNARIVLQVHYNTVGRGGEDQSQIGLYFSKKPVDRRLLYIPVANTSFRIPAGDPAYEARASLTVPFLLDAKLHQIVPHMHMLGRDIKVELDRRGEKESLIWIDNWDFHWQNFYFYTEPVALPSGSTVRLTCRWDNSSSNPHTPNESPREVRWGETTADEMCLVFLGVTFDRNILPFARSVQANR